MENKRLNAVHMSKKFGKGRAKPRPYKACTTTITSRKEPAGCRRYKKGLDGVEVWKQCEDLVVPRLKLSVHERAVYYHLLRHSRLEGKAQLRFSIGWLRRGANLTIRAARKAVRGLVAKGALRVFGRGRTGHLVEVRLPEEIRAVRACKIAADAAAQPKLDKLEDADFLGTKTLREAVHRRECGRCFYCMRRVTPKTRCLDHVVPLAHLGSNSYCNLVSSCGECNSLKADRRAGDFLRWLFREGRLTSAELAARLRALRQLASGKLRPPVPDASRPSLTPL